MTESSLPARARLFTAFGTMIYFDSASHELRHAEFESIETNVLFVLDPSSAGSYHSGCLMHEWGDFLIPMVCGADRCRPISPT